MTESELMLREFNPRSHLVTKATEIKNPRFPVIDAHNHLAEPFGGGWDKKPLNQLLDRLDAVNVRHYVDLDGGWGRFQGFWTVLPPGRGESDG